jgi:hypothetical protein
MCESSTPIPDCPEFIESIGWEWVKCNKCSPRSVHESPEECEKCYPGYVHEHRKEMTTWSLTPGLITYESEMRAKLLNRSLESCKNIFVVVSNSPGGYPQGHPKNPLNLSPPVSESSTWVPHGVSFDLWVGNIHRVIDGPGLLTIKGDSVCINSAQMPSHGT